MTDKDNNMGLLASSGGGAGGRGGAQERANHYHNPKSVRSHLVQNISHVPIRRNKTTQAM